MTGSEEATELLYNSLSEINLIAKKILNFAEDKKIWLFEGEMGAGKTTLIKAICEELKVTDNVQSPTFSIVNEYRTIDEKTIFHFDFYRLNHESEAMDIGIEEYFDSGDYCFLEWPSKISSLIPDEILTIEIINNEGSRHIRLKKL